MSPFSDFGDFDDVMMNHVSANLVVNICRDIEVVADRSRIAAIGFDREAVSWTPR